MQVFLRDIETEHATVLQVLPGDSVQSMIDKYMKEEGGGFDEFWESEEKLVVLVFKDEVLSPNRSLESYGICDGSELEVEGIWDKEDFDEDENPPKALHIYIQAPNMSEPVELDVLGSDTIESVKAGFQVKAGFLPQLLMYNGRRLHDCLTLRHYQVRDNSTLEIPIQFLPRQ